MSEQGAMPKVLFLCTHNSARSQMAEGLLRHLTNSEVEVHSAGTVATRVKPEAIKVMGEIGIDIQAQSSKVLDGFVEQRFGHVITVCDQANESCPIFPNAEYRWHWSIEDPSGVQGDDSERLAAFRAARDELRTRIQRELIPEIHPRSGTG